MKLHISLILSFILILFYGCAEQGEGDKYIVGAFYYPWYESGTGWIADSVRTPYLGEYSSSDPAVAQQHIRWARDYGIDFFCLSWWGEGWFGESYTFEGILGAQNIDQIRFCILYETVGRLGSFAPNFDDPQVSNTFISDFDYLADTFFSYPSYFRIGGRPVVWIYLAQLFNGDYEGALQKVRDNLEQKGYDIYLVGDIISWFMFNDYLIPHFDGINGYNMYTLKDPSIEYTWQLAEALRPAYEEWRDKALKTRVSGRENYVDFHPTILPQYDDTLIWDTQPQRRGNTPMPAASKEDFRMMCEMARDLSQPVGDTNSKLIWVTSWNEWFEGTTIEPTIEDANKYPGGNYGFDFLESIREVFLFR